jgi:hypothetical protein
MMISKNPFFVKLTSIAIMLSVHIVDSYMWGGGIDQLIRHHQWRSEESSEADDYKKLICIHADCKSTECRFSSCNYKNPK